MVEIRFDPRAEGKIISIYVESNFDIGIAELKKYGYRIPSLEEDAKIRMQADKESLAFKEGNWVREGVVYIIKEGRVFLTKNSPVLKNPKKATDSHRYKAPRIDRGEYSITDKQLEEALENSIEIYFDSKEIPTDRFGENEIANFCFGEVAKDYGLFLKNLKMKNIEFHIGNNFYMKSRDSNYSRQLHFCGLDFPYPFIDGFLSDLDSTYLIHGIKDIEKKSKNNLKIKQE